VEAIEGYVKHRPLTAFTADVSPENVRMIRELLDGLTPEQRTALNLREVDGQPYLNHWYMMISGTKS